MGLSLWVKLPGLLAVPALLFAFRSWRNRCVFAGMLLAVGTATYWPVLAQDAELVVNRVFLYQGMLVGTTKGMRGGRFASCVGAFIAGRPRGSRLLISPVFISATTRCFATDAHTVSFSLRSDATTTDRQIWQA